MFSDKLNELLSILGGTSTEIARRAGFDRTNISHLRNGKRTPSPDSPTIQKLALGIIQYADTHRQRDLLSRTVGADPKASPEELREQMKRWLYEGNGGCPQQNPPVPGSTCARRRWRTYGERLDRSMILADLSNIRLSQLVYADPSLISRYRRGVRTPAGNPDLAERIADAIWERIRRNGREEELSRLLHISGEGLTRNSFGTWLTGQDNLSDQAMHDTETLLSFFDGALRLPQTVPVSTEDILREILPSDKKAIYRTTEGLREAVLRFLSDALRQDADELLLYSDEDMGWMTADQAFFGKWASLMTALVNNGTKIRIIHNIERDLAEMNRAIVSWLPLYPSGKVESYYCRLPGSSRFTHTIFLSPGLACIEAFHTRGTEFGGIYHYYTEPGLLSICEREYLALLRNCGTLLKTGNLTPYRGDSDLCFLQNTLRIGTMPEDLVESFRCPALTVHWHNVREAGLEQLKKHRIIEHIPLVSDEDLFAGKAMVEPFPGMEAEAGRKTGMKKLRYTPEQYALHIQNILTLLETHPNYSFIPIPEAPFPNIKLLISDDLTRIDMLEQPELSFGFTHPLMCRAFRNYVLTLSEPWAANREDICRMLAGRYL